MPAPTTVVWFRRDLRVMDHPALHAAVERGHTVCLFVLDPGILARRHHRAPARLRFLRAGMEALDAELRARGSGLVVRRGDPAAVVPALCAEVGADRVHATREVSPLGRARDERVRVALAAAGVTAALMGGDLVVEPPELAGRNGTGYLVFTPFYRVWRDLPVPEHIPAPGRIPGPVPGSDPIDLPSGDPPLPAGPRAARERLVAFVAGGHAARYGAARNGLADDATSHLSAYLRLGMCTGAQIGRALGLPGPVKKGTDPFWRQVCWREFYHHHLLRHPHVARRALRPEFRAMRWDDRPAHLDAWTRGETGVPVVDAGMRQMAETGWMHNRARMLVASFLVKDLLVDWRKGERVFMQSLVDGDPANNNGGWQWTAGTGTDAAPYFRVMNPLLQARRFDPAGEYVRRWVPELREVPDGLVHEPWRMSPEEQRAAGCRIGSDYPAPVVDHAERRQLVLDRYREAREGSGRSR
jgi:deoxyribodipyrimidine photo-lyase